MPHLPIAEGDQHIEGTALYALTTAMMALVLRQPVPSEHAQCHEGITTMKRCMRCSDVIRAAEALAEVGCFLPSAYFGQTARQ